MNKALIWIALGIAATAFAAMPEILTQMPNEGAIPYGKIAYVDDGKCPKGEVTEVTGGSLSRKIPRQTRCVPRPKN